ncbi:unnamed protein product [Oikopleura dioica]|uniref:ODAD1 central coiled coil region domain-containing protein n=1 Tax=Oikopleura dioica TaxID=34765 RepID=E4YCB4_OIKDI|nr:unnamed protein product [Oikopleura dioica]
MVFKWTQPKQTSKIEDKIKNIVEDATKERHLRRQRRVSDQYSESEDEEEVNYQELIKSAYAIKKESKSRSNADIYYKIVANDLEKEKARLLTEFEELQTTANLLNSKSHRKGDLRNIEKLRELVQGQDTVEEQIENEKLRIRAVEDELTRVEKETTQKRKEIGGINHAHIKQQQTTHSIKCLEDRLHKTTVEYNELTAENNRLREGIDHLRKERKKFNTQYKRYKSQLGSAKQEQRSLTEKSMIAFDQTDDANSKMAAVSERESKNNAQNMNELRELLRHIDHDTSVKDFLVTKSQDRSAQAEALAQSRRAATQNKFEAAAEKTLNEYQNAIKEVKELTGANSFEGIVDHYLKMEEANYAKFNFINEMTNQLQETQDKIKLIEQEIAALSAASDRSVEENQIQLNELKADRDGIKASIENTANAAEDSQKEISRISSKIIEIFDFLECDKKEIQARLGSDSASLDPQTLLMYISGMESKITELLAEHLAFHALTESRSDESQKSNYAKNSTSSKSVKAPLVVELIKTEEIEVDTEAIIPVSNIRQLAAVSIVEKEIERERERQAQLASEKKDTPKIN